MRTYRLTLGYDGTEFFGSQSQAGRRTVQDELERALQRLAPGAGRTTFAGRTDRGVHAVGQVVSVELPWRDDDERLRDALNAVLPGDIGVLSARRMDGAFHARYDALTREYRYRIVCSPVPPVLERRYVWWRRAPLDANLAREGCAPIVGEHAFGSFAGSGRSRTEHADELVRRVDVCEWTHGGRGRHTLRVVANGFLPQMVRNITGALVQVGARARDPDWIGALIEANDRRALGDAAPPAGLTLWRVRYSGDEPDEELTPAGTQQDLGYGEV